MTKGTPPALKDSPLRPHRAATLDLVICSRCRLALDVLERLPANQATIARRLGRKKSDGSVRRALHQLEHARLVARDADGNWKRRGA